MEKEPNLQKEKLDLLDYIKENSQVLIRKEDLNEELAGLAKPGRATIGYYDSKNVKFSVEGYDFIYFSDESGDLMHVKIKPEEISYLERAGKLGEADDLEDQLIGSGFILDQSEKLKEALYKKLNA